MNSARPLREAALRLKNAAPEEFDTFVKAFETYTGEITVAVTMADANEIMTAKGSALACMALERLMKECHLTPQPKPAPQQ